jgi:hypothetical protein
MDEKTKSGSYMKIRLFLGGCALFSVIFFGACAGTRESAPEKKPAETGSRPYDESFDPGTLDDDDIVIGPPSSSADNTSQTDDQVAAGTQNKTDSDNRSREVNGFRVQILATNNIETASLVEQEANDRFSGGGNKTYLVFEAPLYKIRIGDCENRADAEALRDQAVQNGYSGAFIVKSKINVQP